MTSGTKPKCVKCCQDLARYEEDGGVVYRCIGRSFLYSGSAFIAEGCNFALVVLKGGKDEQSL